MRAGFAQPQRVDSAVGVPILTRPNFHQHTTPFGVVTLGANQKKLQNLIP